MPPGAVMPLVPDTPPTALTWVADTIAPPLSDTAELALELAKRLQPSKLSWAEPLTETAGFAVLLSARTQSRPGVLFATARAEITTGSEPNSADNRRV